MNIMKQNLLKVIAISISIILVIVLILAIRGLINMDIFWIIIVLSAVFAFIILPRIKNKNS